MQDQYKQDGVQRRPVKKIITHPDYNQMTFDYDIALLELSEPLEFTNTIQPICLPAPSHIFPAGTSCWVTGWGAIREGGIMHELNILDRTVICCFSLLLVIIYLCCVLSQFGVTHSTVMFSLSAYPTKIKTSHSSPIFLEMSYSSLSFIFLPCLLPPSSLYLVLISSFILPFL